MVWSSRRKILYSSLFILFLIGVVGLPLFYFVYKAPTCNDGKQNGGETGVDCGGSCSRLCQSAFLPLRSVWARYDKVGDGLYNVASYIINPNLDGAVRNIGYTFKLYDASGNPIGQKSGNMYVPPHKNILAFESAVATSKLAPARITFDFTSDPVWDTVNVSDNFIVTNKQFIDDSVQSVLTADIQNKSLIQYSDVIVAAILYDADGNVLGFSKTILDTISKGGTETATFTWPKSFSNKVVSTEVVPYANTR